MTKLIIIFEIRDDASGEIYNQLVSRIVKRFIAVKITSTVYLTQVEDYTPVQIRDFLKEVIKKNDSIFVGKISGPAAWHGIPSNVSNRFLEILS